ncbi:MAG TPA: AMP-binding protein, partial [Clostridia bacterium]
MIIDLLKESVIKYGCKNAVCCDDKEITFKELYEEIIQLSYLLKANGVRKGDHVALLMMNSIEFIKAFFAVNQCGGGVIPIYVN